MKSSEGLVLLRQLFHFGSLQFRPLAPEHGMTTMTTALNTSFPLPAIIGMIYECLRNVENASPPKCGGGTTSRCLSRLWLKKNPILWRCIPSNQYITGNSERCLSALGVNAIWRYWHTAGMCCCAQWDVLHVQRSPHIAARVQTPFRVHSLSWIVHRHSGGQEIPAFWEVWK
jgi:hypothetical protein